MNIDNMQDVIDSRDIIEHIEELESKLEEYKSWDEAENDKMGAEWEELDVLRKLAEEAEGYAPDWNYGATLIRDDSFTEYAMELLSDTGDLPREIPHYIVIDEEATARNIQQDYTAVDFDGVTYWIR